MTDTTTPGYDPGPDTDHHAEPETLAMSIDRSLKTAGNLSRHRNVLTRDERIAKLAERGEFDTEKDNPIGLPKVGNRKVVAAGKTKKKKAGEEEATEETK